MRLLHRNDNGDLSLSEFLGNKVPLYAILSHTWGADGEEVTFKDIEHRQASHKLGWKKIDFCERQAASYGLKYFWVDTCCIDKSSSAELAEAINTMFRWYRDATKCYVYLGDVSTPGCGIDNFETEFRKSRWFTRGWTLQELIAPASVEFFSVDGTQLGDKQSLEVEVQAITGIDIRALRGGDLSSFGVAQKMAWASNRKTTREEDQAYCLLGIFDVHMPLIYGEGKRAFRRLEKEIRESANLGEIPNSQQMDLARHGLLSLNPNQTREELLYSIFYPENTERRENVQPPWENTFQWIFQDNHENPTEWFNFPEWLRDNSSTYWISGKAGSGKSTLMAYILHEDKLKDNLKIWSQGHDIHVLSFFFWRAGSVLQKSVIGMLRSLLYQLLEEIPDSANNLVAKFGLTSGRIPSWTEKSLVRLLQVALGAAPDQNFCLFIDGIDEFEGDTDELLNLLFQLQALGNIKCCLSSRPEVQLVTRLSNCKQLRLQDLNFNDIHNYVKEKMTSSSDSNEISDIRSTIATEIAVKAEGVFLWAALVTKSMIQGFQAGDDDEMVRRRVKSTPSEMVALFVQMLESVDDVHRDSLSFYLQAMRSKALSQRLDYETTSVALITASLHLEDPTRYQDFVVKCQRTEKQIVAQSKGLLEVRPGVDWKYGPLFASNETKESLVWSIPQDLERGTKSSTRKSRKDTIHSRRPIPLSSFHQEFLDFEHKIVSFVHRSAYDFVCSREFEKAFGKWTAISSASVQSRLVQGGLKLLAAAPRVDQDYKSRIKRRLVVIQMIAGYADLPNKGYEYLDELQDMITFFSHEELLGAEKQENGESTDESWNQRSPLYRQNLGRLYFWKACIEGRHQVDYVQEHLSDITKLDCRGVIFSTLCQNCIVNLSEGLKKEVACPKNLLMLLISMLKELELQYKDMTLAPASPRQRLHFGEISLPISSRREFDISWLNEETAPPFHDDEIVCQMSEVTLKWFYFIQKLTSGKFADSRDSKSSRKEVDEITSLIERIIEPWDLHIGTRPIQLQDPSLGSESYIFFEMSAVGFTQNVYQLGWKRHYKFAGATTLGYDSAQNIRIVCTSRSTSKGSNAVKNFKDRVVATHDLGPCATARLLDFLYSVRISDLQRSTPANAFHGDWDGYLECQQLMVDDVWENVDQKLDAWQQLYTVACLETRLRNTWRILA